MPNLSKEGDGKPSVFQRQSGYQRNDGLAFPSFNTQSQIYPAENTNE